MSHRKTPQSVLQAVKLDRYLAVLTRSSQLTGLRYNSKLRALNADVLCICRHPPPVDFSGFGSDALFSLSTPLIVTF